ncbi:pikAI, partial [Symbiodinium microadriaticum]
MSLGFDTTTELPPERWDMDAYYDADVDAPGKTYVRLGHFIPGIDQFDGDFFGVSEAELRSMDPHQWLSLEISYEAFHAAGLNKESLQGMDCGVFVGCCNLGGNDVDPYGLGPFSNIGFAYSGLSGRISHVLSLRGPCFTVDTACSSTIVALDSSCQTVRMGRCQSAVATGANVQLSGCIWVGFSKMRGLAFDGRCKTFDSRADGFARGEGLGSAFIRGGENAEVSNLVGLSGVAINHDGRAATITAPNGTAQQRVLRAALADRGTQGEDVTCIECHGTGTALGDPIEVGAQKAVYGKGRTESQPLILAATKSNIGHLEGSAGVAGISKVILAITKAQITPNLHLEKLNPNIDLGGFNTLMPDKLVEWKSASLRSGVSSFGFSGTNGHGLMEAILTQPSEPKVVKPMRFARKVLKPWREWMQKVVYFEEWVKADYSMSSPLDGKLLLVTDGDAMAGSLTSAMPSKPVAVTEVGTAADIGEKMKRAGTAAAVFARCLESGRAEPLPGSHLEELVAFLQGAILAELPKLLVVVTRGAYDAKRENFDAGALIWGLIRSARMEMPRVTIKTVDVAVDASPADIGKAIAAELQGPDGDVEVAYTSEGRCVPRLVEAPQNEAVAMQRQDAMRDADSAVDVKKGVQIVTGGLGGLGLVAAEELAALGAPGLLLTSRSGRVAEGQKRLEEQLRKLQALPGLNVQLKICNAGEAGDVAKLVKEAKDAGEPVQGVVHAAGVMDRCPLPDLDTAHLNKVLAPKANGAWHLHSECPDSSLFVLFSSVSAIVGLAGSASYSSANAYLDALATWRRGAGRSGVSLQWGPVSEVGITAAAGSDNLEAMALKTLSPAQVGSALRLCLAAPTPRAEVMLARVDWPSFMREIGMEIPQLMDLKSKEESGAGKTVQGAGGALAQLPLEERRGEVLKSIRAAASGMGLDMDDNTPLMEAGIDSLSAVEFRNKVSNEFRSVTLPSTLMFDYPTLTALADYVSEQLVPETATTPTLAMPQPGAPASNEAIAILGGACHLPGDSWSLEKFDFMLSQGVDCSVEMPQSRWDVDDYYDPDATTGLKMYVKHAAFIEGVELFAAAAFNINKAEAETMDPQQRHLLEAAFEAFTAAGLGKSTLMGSYGGVFVGQDKCDWNRMITGDQSGPYAATGGSSSISANRISYVLGLKGPSATMDTACSSSLVAADTAAVTLRRRRSELAVVCGVNMTLLPQTFVACCQAQMLSKSGRCRTFDDTASGYARGEGVGAQALERLGSQVSAGPDAGLLAELHGSALNQDGRSSNLTSPNGPSQQAVVLAALGEAQVQPAQHVCVETHGTGTALGDPIEVGALKAVLGGSRLQTVQLGAAKTNVGHLEGGAGMVGLTKLASILSRNCLPANLHLRVMNSHIYDDMQDFPVNFVSDACPSQAIAAASVSSFGFGGTNGHVLLARPATRSKAGLAAVKRSAADLERQAYPWREASHPLLKRRTTRADGATVFSCSFGGHVLALLSHHIVHGEVVVPGACYLEMIVAGCTTFVGSEAWCVENLGFAKPLVLRLLPDGSLEEPTEMRLVLRPDGRLEVESEIGSDPEDSIVSVHVEATLVMKSGGWVKTNRPEQDGFDLNQLRSQCPEPVDIDLMYSFGRKSGLPLQPRFRTVRHVQKGDKESFARLEMEKDGTHVGFWLGPSLIDGSFQASMALADAATGIGTLKIPLSIRRLQPCGRPFSIGVWSYFQLIDFTDKSTVFRSWLLNDAGEALLYFDHVHLQEVRDEHIQKVLQASGRQGMEQQMLYDVSWRPTPAQDPAAKSRWLLLGSPLGLKKLKAAEADPRCRCVELDLEAEDLPGLLTEETWSAVILADGLMATDASSSAWAKSPADSAAPGGEHSDVSVLERAMVLTKACAPDHSGLWGFARAVRMEYPGALRVTCVDLDASKESDAWAQLSTDILPALPAEEEEIAIRDGEMSAAKLARSVVKYTGAVRLNMPARGSLTGLRVVPQADTSVRVAAAPGMAQLRIRAVGLNFRDVLNVMGLYPGDPGPPGADCGGTVIGLGDNVPHLRLAEDIFGESPGCLSTYNTSSAALLSPKPTSWTYEEACCMPVIFVTVEEALGDLAKLKRGERVLIHAAAGGVGLVAI